MDEIGAYLAKHCAGTTQEHINTAVAALNAGLRFDAHLSAKQTVKGLVFRSMLTKSGGYLFFYVSGAAPVIDQKFALQDIRGVSLGRNTDVLKQVSLDGDDGHMVTIYTSTTEMNLEAQSQVDINMLVMAIWSHQHTAQILSFLAQPQHVALHGQGDGGAPLTIPNATLSFVNNPHLGEDVTVPMLGGDLLVTATEPVIEVRFPVHHLLVISPAASHLWLQTPEIKKQLKFNEACVLTLTTSNQIDIHLEAPTPEIHQAWVDALTAYMTAYQQSPMARGDEAPSDAPAPPSDPSHPSPPPPETLVASPPPPHQHEPPRTHEHKGVAGGDADRSAWGSAESFYRQLAAERAVAAATPTPTPVVAARPAVVAATVAPADIHIVLASPATSSSSSSSSAALPWGSAESFYRAKAASEAAAGDAAPVVTPAPAPVVPASAASVSAAPVASTRADPDRDKSINFISTGTDCKVYFPGAHTLDDRAIMAISSGLTFERTTDKQDSFFLYWHEASSSFFFSPSREATAKQSDTITLQSIINMDLNAGWEGLGSDAYGRNVVIRTRVSDYYLKSRTAEDRTTLVEAWNHLKLSHGTDEQKHEALLAVPLLPHHISLFYVTPSESSGSGTIYYCHPGRRDREAAHALELGSALNVFYGDDPANVDPRISKLIANHAAAVPSLAPRLFTIRASAAQLILECPTTFHTHAWLRALRYLVPTVFSAAAIAFLETSPLAALPVPEKPTPAPVPAPAAAATTPAPAAQTDTPAKTAPASAAATTAPPSSSSSSTARAAAASPPAPEPGCCGCFSSPPPPPKQSPPR